MATTDRTADGRPFSVDVERLDTKVTVSPRGDLDMATAEQFGYELESLITSGERIVVDCQQLGFLDSSGIKVLLRAYISCQEHGAALELQSVPPALKRALEFGGVAGLLGLDHAAGARATHDVAEQR